MVFRAVWRHCILFDGIWGMRLIPFRIWIAADIILLVFSFLFIWLRNRLATKKVLV